MCEATTITKSEEEEEEEKTLAITEQPIIIRIISSSNGSLGTIHLQSDDVPSTTNCDLLHQGERVGYKNHNKKRNGKK